MAQLGIVVDPTSWTASYPSRPYEPDSPRVIVPLMQPLPSFLLALAQYQHRHHQAEWVATDVNVGALPTMPYVMGFQCTTCFMTHVSNAHPRMHSNLDDSKDGRGTGSSGLFRLSVDEGKSVGQTLLALLRSKSTGERVGDAVPHHEVYAALAADMERIDEPNSISRSSDCVNRTNVYTQKELDLIPALPHASPGKMLVMDLQALNGERYIMGCSALYLCSRVLTSMVVDVT